VDLNTHNIGKIAGGIGLVLLLSSPFTWFLTSGSPWLAIGKAALGAALVASYFATNWRRLGQFASRRSTFFFGSAVVTSLLVLGALVAINFVAEKKNRTWDLTRQKIHSLAPQTVAALQGLKDTVQVTAFVPTNSESYDQIRDLLDRYHRVAPEKFEYLFKDPRKTPDLAEKYQLREGDPTVVLARGSGEKQTHKTVQFPSYVRTSKEQDLTNGLLALIAAGEQKVYFLAGHGELTLEPAGGAPGTVSELAGSLRQEGYTAETLNLAGKTEVPRDAAAVAIAGARSRLTEPEEAALGKYLSEGGRVLVFAEAGVELGLDKLLGQYGVQIDPGILADAQFAVQSPYNVVSIFYGEHEIVELLRVRPMNVQFATARGLTVLKEGLLDGVSAKPAVLSSPFAWLETTPNEMPEPSEGEKQGQIPMVVASSRTTASAPNKRFDEARLVVFGDSDIIADVNWGVEPNRNLVLNAFGWASNQANRITIRPPDRDISTVELDQDMLSRIRFVATDVLPMTLLAIGVGIWITRRNQ
jgi:ABC-type uncharacterized transport system involved in gliding motility auxiliary subunit